tara:strand:- start:9529 stop:11325 length:1797 start_codon:yes stop_codon:yes gene_type:complete
MAKRPINYTSRDFESIKGDLENYAKRYYPSTFKDFSEASFGSLMLDLVAYVGDQLSFYADFQANESFLDSSIRYDNVIRLSETLGYKNQGAAKSTGQVAIYMLVPVSTTSRSPDVNYLPILQKGAIFTGDNGAAYTLIADIDFSNPNNEITVARTDVTTGNPTFFAVKALGQIVSGQQFQEKINVTDYQRFLRVSLGRSNITEILSILDSQGNEYYEVENLSQDVVLTQIKNVESTSRDAVPYTMRIKPVPRRFTTDFSSDGVTRIQFGYGSEDNLTGDVIADPADVVLEVQSKPYITETTFDPTNLIQTDKFGIVPVNTTLTITYTANTTATSNASVGSVTNIISPDLLFRSRAELSEEIISTMVSSIEVDNEQPISGDSQQLTAQEIKIRAFGTYAAQNRAVTREDYMNLAYRMPAKFGKIKRCNVIRDENSLKRNLNMFVLAENSDGDLSIPNSVLKENLKVWLDNYRMINDTIDIMDGNIINIGIRYEIIADPDINRFDLLEQCNKAINDDFLTIKFSLGESVYVSELYKVLNSVPGVTDTTNVEFYNITGGVYSDNVYDIDSNISSDGRFLKIPSDSAAEILIPNTDIVGVIT